jgi:DNA primase
VIDVTSDIRSIAYQYLQRVSKSGSDNIMALCPFHKKTDGTVEKHPSFAMSLTTGLWFCHSCQSKGNLYTFLKDFGVGRAYIERVYRPTIDASSRNKPRDPDPTRPNVFTENPLPEGLLGIFEYVPYDLLSAGFSEETLSSFDIGFDMQHVRTTYPLRDLAGRLVGISGRSVTGDWPKYKVYTDEYRVWDLPARMEVDKRTILWNAHSIYQQVYFNTNPDYVVVVEGFKACMWLHQAGITNVVALLGTYLSWEQKWMLQRMGAPVYLFLDNNEPGQIGLEKTAEALKDSRFVHIVEYPERLIDDENAQPDSLTVDEVRHQVPSAVNYFEWRAH